MTKKKNTRELTDASLQYYHKNTLNYLLQLDVLRYQEQQNDDGSCTVEQTNHFQTLIKNTKRANEDKQLSFETIFQDLAKNKGIKLRKKPLFDMIKLMSLEYAETSLSYYHRDTLKYLVELGAINDLEKTNGLRCSFESTSYFTQLIEDQGKETSNKMAIFEQVFLILARKKGVRLTRKLRYDMIKLMGVIDKFGNKGKIWLK